MHAARLLTVSFHMFVAIVGNPPTKLMLVPVLLILPAQCNNILQHLNKKSVNRVAVHTTNTGQHQQPPRPPAGPPTPGNS